MTGKNFIRRWSQTQAAAKILAEHQRRSKKPDDNLPEITDVAYKTSELGHKFHSSLDKVILADKIKKLKSKKGSQ